MKPVVRYSMFKVICLSILLILTASSCKKCDEVDGNHCKDKDGDGFFDHIFCGTDIDCDNNDPDNWFSCASCVDGDADTWFTGCDAYINRQGPDCDDSDQDNWVGCGSCVDGDKDGSFLGCDSYTAINGPDCDDTDPDNWVSCGSCVDGDKDGSFLGCDAYTLISGPDCDDTDPANWDNCGNCQDLDKDTYFAGCDSYVGIKGPDCNDADPNNWTSCNTCIDDDKDTFYELCDVYDGIDGPDCDDTDPSINPAAVEIVCDGEDQTCTGDDYCQDPPLLWVHRMGGSANDSGYDIAPDSSGNLYAVGTYGNTVDFGEDFGTIDIKSTNASLDGYLSKLGTDGSYDWTARTASNSINQPTDMAVDSSGNIFLTGSFMGSFDMGAEFGASDPIGPSSGSDIFITRINANGTYAWTRTIGGTGDDRASGIDVDSTGKVCITGAFQGSVDFGADFGTTDTHTGSTGSWGSMFITCMDSNAVYSWTGTATGYSSGHAIDIDPSGNVYVTGDFGDRINADGGTVDFAAGFGSTDPRPAPNYNDIFVTKINANGSYAWTITAGGSARDYGNDLVSDSGGNIYVTGEYVGTVDFGTDLGVSAPKTAAGSTDIFIMRINADGTMGWVRSAGGIENEYVRSISIGPGSTLSLIGSFKETVDFGADFGFIDSKTSAGFYDIFVMQLSTDGSYGWTKRMGGTDYDQGYGIAADGAGNLYLTGTFEDTVNFGADFGVTLQKTADARDIFVAKIGLP